MRRSALDRCSAHEISVRPARYRSVQQFGLDVTKLCQIGIVRRGATPLSDTAPNRHSHEFIIFRCYALRRAITCRDAEYRDPRNRAHADCAYARYRTGVRSPITSFGRNRNVVRRMGGIGASSRRFRSKTVESHRDRLAVAVDVQAHTMDSPYTSALRTCNVPTTKLIWHLVGWTSQRYSLPGCAAGTAMHLGSRHQLDRWTRSHWNAR